MLVTGCVAQAENSEILKNNNYVDGVVGPQSYHLIPEIIKKIENSKNKINSTEFEVIEKFDTGKLIVEGKNLYDSESSFIKERRKDEFC